MKKYLSSLLIIFSMAFAYNANAQCSCPTGWTSTSVSTTIQGCDVIIHYCYYQDPTTSSWSVQRCGITILNSIGCSIVVNSEEFQNNVVEAIGRDLETKTVFSIPPCGPQYGPMVFEYSQAACQAIYNVDPDVNVAGDEYSTIGFCTGEVDPGQCINSYAFCYDEQGNLIMTKGTPVVIGGGCDYSTVDITPWGSSTQDCFKVCY